MTHQPDFSGIWIKVERAKEHFRDLYARYQEFRRTNPYERVAYDEPDTGDLVFKAKVLADPPVKWSAIVGDTIHNLRSSLDLLVCELVRANGNKVTDQTGFPIAKSAKAFQSGYIGKVKGTPKIAVDIIKAAKPYKGGEDAFWKLHRLDIVDKHKLLLAVGMAYQSVVFDFARAFDDVPDLPPELAVPQELKMPVGIRPADRQFPLKDGAELFRIAAQARNDPMAQMHMNPQFVFEVAFGEGEVVEGEPLIPTLRELIQFVEGFIKPVEGLFSQKSTP